MAVIDAEFSVSSDSEDLDFPLLNARLLMYLACSGLMLAPVLVPHVQVVLLAASPPPCCLGTDVFTSEHESRNTNISATYVAWASKTKRYRSTYTRSAHNF